MKHSIYLMCLLFIALSTCKNKSTKKTTESAVPQNTSPTKKVIFTAEMVKFNGGTCIMGSNNGTPKEAPEHNEEIMPFYLDKYPVTVKLFRAFISTTHYVTDAEKFGDSGIFDFETQRWNLLPGTYWEYPMGPQKEKAKDNHPVTHVSWNDAIAYCKWSGKRLPSEAEWEYAAKNSGEKTLFPWGNDLKIDGKWMCNVFQGTLAKPVADDGFLFTAPVGSFSMHPSGLFDMSGNVWEWIEDVYRPYPGNNEAVKINPDVKCMRGGSFMYDAFEEASYTTSFRSSNTSETSLFNVGFRCALSANESDQ